MDARSPLRPVLFALLLQAAGLASAAETLNLDLTHKVGETAAFSLEGLQRSNISNLLWRSSSRGSMEALANWVQGNPVNTLSPHYSKRVTFRPERWALEIHHLSTADGGFYEVLEQGPVEMLLKTYTLVVFNITTTVTEKLADDGSCRVSLLCEAGAGATTPVEYSWSPPGWKGSALRLTLQPDDKGKVYTCTASALGTQRSRQVTPYEACSSAIRAAGGFLLGPLLLALLLLL